MKKTKLWVLSLAGLMIGALLASCSIGNGGSSKSNDVSSELKTSVEEGTSKEEATSPEGTSEQGTSEQETSVTEDTSSAKDTEDDNSGTGAEDLSGASVDQSGFTITTKNGTYSQESYGYLISAGGSYTLSGTLQGKIYVVAGDDEDVELELAGATIEYNGNSPIYCLSGDSLKIKAKKNTINYINDTRPLKTTDNIEQGNGAIYSKVDTKFAGTGTLIVTSTYNNGIHSTKDLQIQKQTMEITAPNKAIKGNDSVSIVSGTITAISKGSDAIKTVDSDVSSKGNQRGTVSITGGTLNLYSFGDGIDAAYDAIIANGVDEDTSETTIPNINIYTNKYSSYSDASIAAALGTNVVSSSVLTQATTAWGPGGPGGGSGGGPGGHGGENGNTDKATDSAKGIKAANTITISGGVTNIEAYDDGVHANYGDTLENGSKGLGDLYLQGGTTTVNVSDDGFHADRYLNISGGENVVESSYEGFEGNQIAISGGNNYVYSVDDAINAGNSEKTAGLPAKITVSGGYTFAVVPLTGDVDAIDSNGDYLQTGGVMISAGPASQTASSLDLDGSCSVKGGTLLCFGKPAVWSSMSTSGVTKSTLSGTYSNSAYTATFASGNIDVLTLPNYSYSGAYAVSELGSLSTLAKVS